MIQPDYGISFELGVVHLKDTQSRLNSFLEEDNFLISFHAGHTMPFLVVFPTSSCCVFKFISRAAAQAQLVDFKMFVQLFCALRS